MKISHTINGQNVEIELTSAELWDAHTEVQHNGDKADIQELYDWLLPEDIERVYHITKEKLDAGLDEMAKDMHRAIDKWGCPWESARDGAFNKFLSNHAY